jgi:invasion protein IalB
MTGVKFAPGRMIRLLLTAVAALLSPVSFIAGADAQQAQPKKPSPASPQSPVPVGTPAPVQAQPQFVFTPWTKICSTEVGKNVCGVLSEARVETGQVAVAAALVEPKDGSRKLLRVTLPLGVRLEPGTRITIDQGTPTPGYYILCLASGCISDYEAGSDLLDKLKQGRELSIQAVNPGGYPISITIPLLDFAKAYDGPPMDEKAIVESQKKLQDELQRRAEETRKKLEGQQPQAAHSGSAATPPTPGN